MGATASDIQEGGSPEDVRLTLTVGELMLLNRVAPCHPVGHEFNVLSELRGTNGNKTVRARRPETYLSIAGSLEEKGVLRRAPSKVDGTYALTDLGDAVWKAVFRGTWRLARYAAGFGDGDGRQG